jgi:hypothetical protein
MKRWLWSLALVAAVAAAAPPEAEWKPLFDGKTLGSWKETPFPDHGKVTVENGEIRLGRGYMTGITWTKDFPKVDYEIRYEAKRIDGGDFFASLTFPVKDTHCTFITGGWGGLVVGLSSLNGDDASENDTTMAKNFDTGKWYRFWVAVEANRIRCWIDKEYVIDADISDRRVSLRPGEIELNMPLGFASYGTSGAIRNIEYRLLPKAQ